MSQFSLEGSSRKKTVKILTIGGYSVMAIDIIQGLAFVPLYLHFIGERAYGLWLGTGGILAVLAFLDMGMASLTIQRVSSEFGKKNYEGISRYFCGGLVINSGFMLILLGIGITLSFWMTNFFPETTLNEANILTQGFQIALYALIISLFNNTIEGTLNALQKPLIGKIFQLMGAIIGICTVYLLLHGDTPLLAIPIGMLIRSAIGLFPNLIYLTHLFKKNNIKLFNFDKEVTKEYLKLTPSLMLSKFGTSLVSNIEPTLINMFISPEVAVYFSVTKKAGGLVRTIVDRVGGVLYPSMAHLYAEGDRHKFTTFFIKLLNYLIPATLVMFLSLIILNRQFIVLWVGEGNYLGDLTNTLISFSLFTSFTSNFLSYLISATGDIKFASKMVFWESMIKIVMLFLLLKFLGIDGLPIAIGSVGLLFSYIYIKRWNVHLLLNKIQIRKIIKEHIILTAALIILTFTTYTLSNIWFSQSSYLFFIIGAFGVLILFIIVLLLLSPSYKSILLNFRKVKKYE